MLRALRSELVKFRRPSVAWGSVGIVAFLVFGTYFGINQALSGGNGGMIRELLPRLKTANGLPAIFAHIGEILTAIVLIAVTANVAAEWSQGTLRNLLVRESRRLRLLAGKMTALSLYTLLSVALAITCATAIAFVAASTHGFSTAAWTSAAGVTALLRFLGSEMLSILGFCCLGMFFAVITRSAPAAVGLSLAYVLAVEGLLAALLPDAAQWLPGQVFTALTSTSTTAMGYGTALGVTFAWIAGFTVVSAALFRTRDVSA